MFKCECNTWTLFCDHNSFFAPSVCPFLTLAQVSLCVTTTIFAYCRFLFSSKFFANQKTYTESFSKKDETLGLILFWENFLWRACELCCVPELIQNIWVEPLRSLSTSKAERILGFKIGHAHGTCCPCPSHGKLKGWIPLCVNGNLSIKKTWVTLRYSNLWFGTKPMFICCTLQFTLMLGVHLDDGCCS